jgi:hypothetical protein
VRAAQIADLVDELGSVKAQAAAISEVENALKAKLIALGVTEADGEFFRATVSRTERETRDAHFKALIEQLVEKHTSSQYRRAHTNATPVTAVRVVARVQRRVA